MASSKDYWTKRAEENDARNLASEMAGIEKIRAAFEQAQAEIQKKIDTFYRKYEEDGSISPADAKKRLTPSELNAFRKEIAKLSKDSSEEEKKRLDQLKQRLYISRQEALLAEIQHFAVKLHAATDETISQTLAGIYKQQESHNHYNLEQHIGWGVNFEGLAPAQIEALIHQGYDGRDFSEKTWYSTTQLVKNLNVLLPQQFLLGRSTQDIANELSKAMKTPRYSAEALVRTEGSNVASQADLNFYQKANIESYEFMATLDDRTSAECQMLDGMHFNVKDAQTGVNLPPIHTNCRSTTLPDVDMDDIDETRLAKDEDGQYIVVPKQTYKQWQAALDTRTKAAAFLSGATVSWDVFDGFLTRDELKKRAMEYSTGEIPDDVLQAINNPELLKKIRANAQTTFNENANRYLQANKAFWESTYEEGLKLKADMDRYVNKMVMYANKLKVIDERAWEKVATPQKQPTIQNNVSAFSAGTVRKMKDELFLDYNVDVDTLSDTHVKHVYEGIRRMYEREPELVKRGLDGLPSVSYFTAQQQKDNQNTYAWVWMRSRKMQLNPKYYTEQMQPLNDAYSRDVRIKWHPNGDIYSTFQHEFGHVLEFSYAKDSRFKLANAIERAWNKAQKSGEYDSKVEWRESISGYATRDLSETWAEAWADWIYNGDNASEATKLIVAEFKKEVEKLK